MSRHAAAGVLLLWLAVPLLVCGCARLRGAPEGKVVPPAAATGRAHEGPSVALTVFAAASLTECLDEFTHQFERSHPGVTVRVNYAGTQELRIQVEQGAKCDVFVSASEPHMEALLEAGYIPDARVLAHNRLCVAADAGSGKVGSLADLVQEGVRLVVATETCPVGQYTRECWEAMRARPEFGPDYVARLQSNVVSEETNARLVLLKVLLGEADAAFVYASDVLGEQVVTLDLPEAVQVKATYMVGTTKGTPYPEAADSYVEGLLSEAGAQLLRAAGLEAP